jgi:hypothetical protein
MMLKRVWTEQRAKFLREVGSVVLGVLIALGIGELAEAVRWKVRVQNSMAAMRIELGGNRFNLVERLTYQDCLEKRLDALGLLLGEARKTGRLPDVRNVGRPGARPFEYAAFEVAKSEGVPLHMDRGRARELANLYENFSVYQTWTTEEVAGWRTLKLMENAAGPVSSDLLTALLQSWADASEQAEWVKVIARQGDEKLGKLGFETEYGRSGSLAALTKRSQMRPVCQPLLVDGKPFSPV